MSLILNVHTGSCCAWHDTWVFTLSYLSETERQLNGNFLIWNGATKGEHR